MKRPDKDEYAEFYETYVSLVPETDILEVLRLQAEELKSLLEGVDEERSLFSYAEGKWTIKEAVGHLIDGERIFSYRALRISRGDQTPIEGFEQNSYVANSGANDMPIRDLTQELLHLRAANLIFLGGLSEAAWDRRGTASGVPVSARALAFIMAGHIRHHVRILNERYAVR